MLACHESHGINGTNLPLETPVVEVSFNGGPRSLYSSIILQMYMTAVSQSQVYEHIVIL